MNYQIPRSGSMRATFVAAIEKAGKGGLTVAQIAGIDGRFAGWSKRNAADCARMAVTDNGADIRVGANADGDTVYYHGPKAPKGAPSAGSRNAAPAAPAAPAKGTKAPRKAPRKGRRAEPATVPVEAGVGGDGLETGGEGGEGGE